MHVSVERDLFLSTRSQAVSIFRNFPCYIMKDELGVESQLFFVCCFKSPWSQWVRGRGSRPLHPHLTVEYHVVLSEDTASDPSYPVGIMPEAHIWHTNLGERSLCHFLVNNPGNPSVHPCRSPEFSKSKLCRSVLFETQNFPLASMSGPISRAQLEVQRLLKIKCLQLPTSPMSRRPTPPPIASTSPTPPAAPTLGRLAQVWRGHLG